MHTAPALGNFLRSSLSVDTNDVTLESVPQVFYLCLYSHQQRKDLKGAGKFSLVISEEVFWRLTDLCTLEFTFYVFTSSLKMPEAASVLCCIWNSQWEDQHLLRWYTLEVIHIEAFKTSHSPPSRQCWVLYRIAKGPFPNDCCHYMKSEVSTLDTHSKLFSQENNFFNTLPLIPPFTWNEIQFKEVCPSTDSVLTLVSLFCLRVSWLVHLSVQHNTIILSNTSRLVDSYWKISRKHPQAHHCQPLKLEIFIP